MRTRFLASYHPHVTHRAHVATQSCYKPYKDNIPPHYKIPTFSPAQSEMQWAAFVKAENGNVTVEKPDFLNTFNVRALEKLKTDIVPTPDENLFVIVKGNIYPLKEKLKEVVSPVKIENVGGSDFNGYEIQKKNLDKAIEIMEYWGLMVTLYDEVA